jgi:uncharacterized membrane protein YhaH (DUF805 family)
LLYWVLRPWRQMFDFSGRATRREYWFFLVQLYAAFFLIVFLMGLAIGATLPNQVKAGPADAAAAMVMVILAILMLVPYLSASIRRIHDHDKTGWLFLLSLVPVAGWIFFLIMMLTPGTQGPNSYGADPRDRLDSADNVSEVFS